MRFTNRLVAGAAAAVIACALAPQLVQAQSITGAIAGKVTDATGKPLAHVPVTITYKPTNTVLHTTTGADGFYSVRDLQVGGPYDVTAADSAHTTETAEINAIQIGDPYQLNLTLQNIGTSAAQTVTVRASRIGGKTIQTGPQSVFGATEIQELPSFSRDLKDTARLNPFVTIDPTNSDAIIIAGNNNHVNTIYVDGVRVSDNFGLNNGGYPTQRSPFSLDIVKEFDVNIAPYDVLYGDFQGGVLNVVTKGGSNDFHGMGFAEYDSNELGAGQVVGRGALHQAPCANGDFTGTNKTYYNGTTSCGGRYVLPKFKDKEYGGYFSGPIIPDRLFFFFDYDKYETTKNSGYVPTGVAGTNQVKGVTAADVTNVTNILQADYNYNAGTYGASIPVQNQDYFARVDANITDKQHLFVTYQRTDGTTLNTPDESVNGTLGLSSSYYIYEQRLEDYTADLTSHWTDKLASEIEYTHQDVHSPSTLVGAPFANFQVLLPPEGGASTGTYVVAGPDISRQANSLDVGDEQIKARLNYTIANNVITLGYERDQVSSSDLFVQYATGQYVFSTACGANNVLTNLANHNACAFTYYNAYNNNPLTAASTLENNTDTFYLQDEFHPLPNLTVKAGIRAEYYTTPDSPQLNPTFLKEYGFGNNLTTNGENVVMPRFGFNWKPVHGLEVYGGGGLFSGGNPIVYFYDNYDNTGNLVGNTTATCGTVSKPVKGYSTTCTNPSFLQGVTGSSIPAGPQAAVTANADAGLGITNSLAPDFHPFAEWKASLGARYSFDLSRFHLGDNWDVHLDYLYQKTQYAPVWHDLFEEANLLPYAAPDGRPEYNPARFANAGRTTGYDLQLADTDKGYGHIVAVGADKSWNFGLTVGYSFTYQDVKDVSAATSSVALSNYSQNAAFDPNNPSLATSSYEIKWENKLSVLYSHNFFGDFATKFSLFMQYREGLPYSYTFYSNATSAATPYDNLFGQTGAAAYRDDQLLYIPKTNAQGVVTATSDPIVTYGGTLNSPAAIAAFNTYLHQTGLIKYAGRDVPRNSFFGSPVTTADIRIEQELPAFLPSKYAKLIGYFDLINVPNFINKNWGAIYQTSFPGFLAPVVAKNCQAVYKNGCNAGTGNFFEYDSLRQVSSTLQTPYAPATPTWAIRIGIRYQF